MSQTDELFEAIGRALDEGLEQDEIEARIWQERGRTRAMLVVDSTGFSRTTKRKGVVYYLTILTRVRRLCGAIFSEHGVIRWRAEADNLFAEFETPDQAVAAAFDLQKQVRKKGYPLDDYDPYEVCIGIGYGRVLVSTHEGVYGDEMNLASKLGEDTAEGGELLLTEEAYLNLSTHEGIGAHRRLIEISGVEIPYFAVFKE